MYREPHHTNGCVHLCDLMWFPNGRGQRSRTISFSKNDLKTNLTIYYTMDWTQYRAYKFRYTVKPGSDPATGVHAFMAILGKEAVFKTQCMYITAGFETKGERGLDTHPHWHWKFVIPNVGENELGNMRKRFQRWAKEDSTETRKGNFLYSLKEETDIKDYDRFFRYPWKQGGRRNKGNGFNFERLPPGFDPELQTALAIEEQNRLWEEQIRAYQKKMQPDTRDLLFDYLDAINAETPFSQEIDILEKMCEFYGTPDDKGYYRSANKQTILGYLNTAKWKYGLESYRETALKWLS